MKTIAYFLTTSSLSAFGFMACTGGSKTLEPAMAAEVEQSAGATLHELIRADSKASRAALAAQLDATLLRFEAESKSMNSRLMVSQIKITAMALRNGAHAICAPEERLMFFRGTDRADTTLAGKPVQFANGVMHATNLGNLLKHYGRAGVTDKLDLPFENVSPFDFGDLTTRHTVEHDHGNTPFISVTASRGVASAFGTKVIVMSICPERAPSTTNQAWAEGEFLPLLGILPEEIVAVEPADEASSFNDNVLMGCYAPEIGKGSRGHSKSVSRENFLAYNELLNSKQEGRLTKSWRDALKDFMGAKCNCADMVARKNVLWKKDWPAHSAGEFYTVQEHCVE